MNSKWAGLKRSPWYIPIETGRDIEDCRNWMARGNYPLGITDCEVCSINGDCGPDCPALSETCFRSEELGYEYAESPESAGERP